VYPVTLGQIIFLADHMQLADRQTDRLYFL